MRCGPVQFVRRVRRFGSRGAFERRSRVGVLGGLVVGDETPDAEPRARSDRRPQQAERVERETLRGEDGERRDARRERDRRLLVEEGRDEACYRDDATSEDDMNNCVV